jgi:hypothetical protein
MDHSHHGEHQPVTSSSKAVEYLKFAGVIAFIIAATVIIFNFSGTSGVGQWIRIFMGVFLVTFAGFKFAGYRMFVMMFAGYDLIAKKSKLYSRAYPFIELLLGLAFLFDVLPVASNILVVLFLGVGSIGVFQEIYHRRSGFYCACLGNIIKLPLSTVSLVEDVTMVLMAAVMLAMM